LVQAQKALLRKELCQKLEALKPAERTRRSGEVLKQLLNHPKFLSARSLLSYIALPSEVETRPFMEEAGRRGKKVFVPCIDPKQKIVAMIEIKNFKELKPGTYGVLEPVFDSKKMGKPEELDLAVIPGMGFARDGERLGRGLGYFDRFLAQTTKAYKIGLAFECQMIEKIPHENNDIKMDEILIG